MDLDSSDDSEQELGPKSFVDDVPASPNEVNSPSDSEESNAGIDRDPMSSPAQASDPGSSAKSPAKSPPTQISSNHSDNDGELSDSSNDSRSSLSSSNGSHKETVFDEIDQLGEFNKQVVPEKPTKPMEIIGHGEDLSDVSDLDSNDGSLDMSDDGDAEPKKEIAVEKLTPAFKKDVLPVEEVEQLDFEAEEVQEKEDKEEGECEGKEEEKSENEGEIVEGDDEGELKGDDLEEGEVSDDDEIRPEETEPRPICRFYNRGQCTWGASCRFLHPGVTDKGNYTMFDMVRPLVPANGPSVYPAIDYRVPYDKPGSATFPAGRKEDPALFESAWERGLRQAKEMMRKSTKRKETDMDFEEKKMNLSIGQEELDKENDYYTRPASPIMKEEPDRWGLKAMEPESKHYREPTSTPRYEEYPEPPYYPTARSRDAPPWAGDYNRRVHYEPRTEAEYSGNGRVNKYRSGPPMSYQHRQPIPDYYDKYDEPMPKKIKKHPAREVIVQRVVDKPYRDDRYLEESAPSKRGRGDEWADPWMRSKSPSGRKSGAPRAGRRQSYSSGSSYSSSSSTRSGSSASSYSSYSNNSRSRSQSKSRSKSGSRSPPIPRNARRKVLPPPDPTLTQRKVKMDVRATAGKGKVVPTANMLSSEKRAASERMLLMNPPAPSPRKQKEVPRDQRPPSPGMMRKSAQNPPPPPRPGRVNPKQPVASVSGTPAKTSNRQPRPSTRPSRSSSGSDSSGSSSDSSESSYSSSSSSREPTPKARPRIVIDERERLALAQKVKAMDALKLSGGAKPQIKLTLKTPGANPPPPTKRSGAGTSLPELPELNLVRRDRPAASPVVIGKKRPAETTLDLESSLASKVAALTAVKPSNKKATSRREELLKQLKAVEDAIARKRSKN